MASRIGVDVGGTFTDLLWYDEESGEVVVAKSPTTPEAPEVGVVAAVDSSLSADAVADSRYFLHGMTIGLNALLTRSGPSLGLLTTRGFRDVLELRRGDRPDPYVLVPRSPTPLVPRHRRLEVTERMRHDGNVETPISQEDVAAAAGAFVDAGVESVAIVFLHAYANPAHEIAAERWLRDAGFEGEVSLSHRVTGEYREYERTITTVADAYVRPGTASYLRRLDDVLDQRGFRGAKHVTRSGGGSMTFRQAEAKPVETIMSGPVAGAAAAAALAQTMGLERVIAADVGGTSFDTSLIVDGALPLTFQGFVEGMPLQIPWVDVRSIGAGGGSIAHVDHGHLMVGPRSAGAVPGPACYGRGGRHATTTDAAVALGMLPEIAFADGTRLDPTLAEAALEDLAERLQTTVAEVAAGIITIAAASMANAIREITIEVGEDPREAALIAFGGAGPLFATVIADELAIDRIVVPPFAGNFSAWGLLGADLTRTAARTHIVPLDEHALGALHPIVGELFDSLAESDSGANGARRDVSLDIRFVGQEHTLNIPVASEGGLVTASIDAITSAFDREYERVFGHALDGAREVVSVRAATLVDLGRPSTAWHPPAGGQEQAPRVQTAYSFTSARSIEFDVVPRSCLQTGSTVTGPAIVVDETTTTYVDVGYGGSVHETGALVLQRGG